MEIVGIGVDIEDIDRFAKHSKEINDPFLKKIFTNNELDYCLSSEDAASRLAVRYAAKEAVMKALSSLEKPSLEYRLIEILNDKNSCPHVIVNIESYKKYTFLISLSHCREKAIAFTVVIRNNPIQHACSKS